MLGRAPDGTREGGGQWAPPRQVQFPQLGPAMGGPVRQRTREFVAVQVQLAEVLQRTQLREGHGALEPEVCRGWEVEW
jgi:hypothetical protein